MKVVLSALFKSDLDEARAYYRGISPRIDTDLLERVKATVRTVVRWRGGDHAGPHGFPCRRCRPFPYLLYYEVNGETLFVLGLVHERRHPDHLKERLADEERKDD